MRHAFPADAPTAASTSGPVPILRRSVEKGLKSVCVALLLEVACLQVVMRYLFHNALPWPEEVASWVFSWAVMLGMALAKGLGAHIPISLLQRLLPGRALALVTQAAMIAASQVLMIQGLNHVERTFAASRAVQMPVRWPFLAVPVEFSLILATFTAFASASPTLIVTLAQNMGASLNSFSVFTKRSP